MGEIVQDENPLGLAPWISAEALNALNVATEEGELATSINPKQLLLALLVLLLGTGAFFMLYSVSL